MARNSYHAYGPAAVYFVHPWFFLNRRAYLLKDTGTFFVSIYVTIRPRPLKYFYLSQFSLNKK